MITPWINTLILLSVGLATAIANVAPPVPWGPNGHRIVGQIASTHLSPMAAAAVAELLGPETLAQAATWPDDIRSVPEWVHSAPWHYVTIEDGQTYETSTKNPAGDAVRELNRFIATLRGPEATKAERVIALRWIVHLVGDLHQPLHVGRGPDRGGNTVFVQWFGERTNLHSVWDDGLIDSTHLSFTELAAFINHPTQRQVREWQQATIIDWVNESLGYRDAVYTTPGNEVRDSYKYAYQNLPLVELRLTQAGVRLAGLLNAIFADTWPEMPDGLQWVRNSAEYQALAHQTYADARSQLMSLAARGALPEMQTWAVALDADETVLDNSLYQVEQRGHYDSDTWRQWVEREQAVAVPGAVAFLNYVRELGGKVAIVSNRRVAQQAATEANLGKLGVPFDIVLLQDTEPGKQSRWDRIEQGGAEGLPPLKILMYFGDSITDFPGLDQRQRLADPSSFANFGVNWFILPNPVYGSWQDNPRR